VAIYYLDHRLVINGVETPMPASPLVLPGGGRLVRAVWPPELTLEWPDGSRMIASVQSFVDPIMVLNPERQGRVAGLWGNFDGDPANDLAARDGSTIPADSDEAEIYQTVGKSWRLTQEESLFDYATGESTATFTDLEFPREIVRVGGLDQAARERAEGVCRDAGVVEPEILEDCILDIVVTGDDSYAIAAARVRPGTIRRTLATGGFLGDELRAELATTTDGRAVVAYRAVRSDFAVVLTTCADSLCTSTTEQDLATVDDALVRMAIAPGDLPVVAITSDDAVSLLRCLDGACTDWSTSHPSLFQVSQMAIPSDGVPWLIDGVGSLHHCADGECLKTTETDVAALVGASFVDLFDVTIAAGDRPAVAFTSSTDTGEVMQLGLCRDPACTAIDVVDVTSQPNAVPIQLQVTADGRPYLSFETYNDATELTTRSVAICLDVDCGELATIDVFAGSNLAGQVMAAAVGGDGLLTVLGTTDDAATASNDWQLIECLDASCEQRSEIGLGPARLPIVPATGSAAGTPVVLYEGPLCSVTDVTGCGIGLLIPGGTR
jgi:hypothetical protein